MSSSDRPSSSGGFACRAITRDPNKDKAKALAAKGAVVVRADLDDRATLEKAFAGAHGAYCVTNFWEHFSAEKEKAQAKNMADAAKSTGVKHVIWSTLEDTRKLMAAGKFEEAVPAYRDLVRAVPSNPGLIMNLGMAV